MKNATKLTAFAFVFMLLSSAAFADPQTSGPSSSAPSATSGGAAGHPYRPGPCHEDVQKFCSNTQKGKILDCLKDHEGQLSQLCEAGMKKHANDKPAATPTSAPSPAVAPTSK